MLAFPLPAQYITKAVDFDGVDDYLSRGADLTGDADSKKGLISAWFRLDGTDGARLNIFRADTGFFNVERAAANIINITAATSASANILTLHSTTTYTAGATWHHLLSSWDLGITTAHLYIDGVDVKAGGATITDGTIDYTRPDFWVGVAEPGTQRFWDGCLADIYLNTTEYLDISLATNRARFRTPGGKPVNLGPTGAQATGTRPILYLRGPVADFAANLGTGGNLTVSGGGLGTASSSPTD